MKVRPLNNEELEAIQSSFDFCKKALGKDDPFKLENIQALYDYTLTKETVPDELVISIGVCFGTILIKQEPHLEWIRLTDEWGQETSLCYSDALIVCSPISMIQKRTATFEPVDLSKLAFETLQSMHDLYVSGNYKLR